MQLGQLLSEIEIIESYLHHRENGDVPDRITINCVTDDSREVRPGSLFIALRGLNHDGHSFIDAAIQAGAAAVISEYPVCTRVPVFRVPDGRIALGQLVSAFYGHPSRSLDVIGITGTNGKTTTSHMVASITSHYGLKTGLIGTLGMKIDSLTIDSRVTTPEATELQHMLKTMVDRGVRCAVLEVSSHGLEFNRVAGVAFDIAALTNISTDHLDLHQSLEQYLSAKAKLFQALGRYGTGVINADEEYSQFFVDRCPAPVITYGLTPNTDFRATDIHVDDSVSRFYLRHGQMTPLEVVLPLPGQHNIYNALAALAITHSLGVPLAAAAAALREFPGVRRRLQTIYSGDFRVIDDFAHNPGSLEAVCRAVRKMDYKDLIPVLAVRGNRGIEVNAENGLLLATELPELGVDRLIATCSTDTVTAKDQVRPEEADAFIAPLKRAGIEVRLIPRLSEAIDEALRSVQSGSLILLLGAQGMDKGAEIILQKLGKNKPYDFLPPSAAPLSR